MTRAGGQMHFWMLEVHLKHNCSEIKNVMYTCRQIHTFCPGGPGCPVKPSRPGIPGSPGNPVAPGIPLIPENIDQTFFESSFVITIHSFHFH